MAKIYVAEFSRQSPDVNGLRVGAGESPAIATQTVAIGAGSVQSAAFDAKTKFVRVHADAICSVKFGSNPTATATDARLAASQTEFFGVQAGDKVAVITNS